MAQLVYHSAFAETAEDGLNDGRPMVVSMRRTSGRLETKLDGHLSGTSQVASVSSDVSAAGASLFIGGTTEAQDLRGDIAQLLILRGPVSDVELEGIEQLLVGYYLR
jgi:hypothetical protein